MILVTGAAGKTGQAVIKRLVAQGQRVRGLVRRQEQAIVLERLGVVEIVSGDINARRTLEQAAEGARAIYHICPNMHPDEETIGRNVIGAAQSAGIEHFVYHSVLHPQVEAMAHHWQKMRVEEMLFASGLSFTILQPAAYMQNVLANWERIARHGVYAVPYALATRLSMVDLEDVAEAAATVLSEPGYVGATYELCGSEMLSQREVATILGRQLGRNVMGETIPIAIWEQRARSTGLGEYAVQTLAAMFRYYEQTDFFWKPEGVGMAARPFADNFCRFPGKDRN